MRKLLVICLVCVGCQRYSEEEYARLKQNCEAYHHNAMVYRGECEALQKETKALQEKRDSLDAEIEHANGNTVYYLLIEISKSSITLSISQHISDAANAVQMELAVDKDFYDAVKKGQYISESFNAGSFWMKGSFSSSNVQVLKKYTKPRKQ